MTIPRKDYYTIGEIHRMGLLRNYYRQPYSDKATISKLVNKMHYKEIPTRWGMAKAVTLDQIRRYNERRLKWHYPKHRKKKQSATEIDLSLIPRIMGEKPIPIELGDDYFEEEIAID